MSRLRGHFQRRAAIAKRKGRNLKSDSGAVGNVAMAADMGEDAEEKTNGEESVRRLRIGLRNKLEKKGETNRIAVKMVTAIDHRRKVVDAIRKGSVRLLLPALRAAQGDQILAAATRTQEGVPCIFLAIERGIPRIVKILIDWGAPVDSMDIYDGRSMLLHAVCLDKTEILRVLLQAGCDVNARDARGRTALMMASYRRNEEAMEMLMAHGAKIEDLDSNGSDAKAWASRGFEKPTADPFLDDDGALFEHINEGERALGIL